MIFHFMSPFKRVIQNMSTNSELHLPGSIFLQQYFDELSRYVQGEHALCHLLQDTQVVSISRGKSVHP